MISKNPLMGAFQSKSLNIMVRNLCQIDMKFIIDYKFNDIRFI